MSDLQRAYETIRAHLIKQGKPAMDEATGSCFYRHNGLMCAVGCLIKDEAYSVALEDMTPDADIVQDALKASGWSFDDDGLDFLRAVQTKHDYWNGTSGVGLTDVIKAIDAVANDWDLKVVTEGAL